MKKRDNNTILSKFISREVEVIYEKYRKIMEDEINLIAKFIKKLEEGKVDFYDPYLEYGNTKALAEDLANEDNVDVIKLYIFLTCPLQKVNPGTKIALIHKLIIKKGGKTKKM